MMLLKVLERIDRDRFVPYVISLREKGNIGNRIEQLGIPVEALGMKPGRLSVHKFVKLAGCLRDFSPDVVHTWMYHADLLGGFASRLAGIRSICWGIRNSDLSERSKLSTRAVARTCAIVSRWVPLKIMSCSNVAKTIHSSIGYDKSKIVVIPNGFDLFKFSPDSSARTSVRCELGLPGDTPLVGLIARSDPQKNHSGFLAAASQVCRSNPDVHFLLAGSDIDDVNSELRSVIQESGIGRNVHLLGRREDIPRLMAALDLLVSSSLYGEAFPNVLGEAMASGVPCVVTDVGDSAEIVGDTGKVVLPGDIKGLAQGMFELLGMSKREKEVLTKATQARVKQRYEIGGVVKQYEQFYLKLIEHE